MKDPVLACVVAIFLTTVLLTAPAMAADVDQPAPPEAAHSTEASSSAFPDVPKDHWARQSLEQLHKLGIIKGYPDGRFSGEASVSRFQLAVVLVRMIEALQAGVADVQTAPQGASLPEQESDPWSRLIGDGYIAANSAAVKDPGRPATPEDVAQAVASVTARIIEMKVPAPKD